MIATSIQRCQFTHVVEVGEDRDYSAVFPVVLGVELDDFMYAISVGTPGVTLDAERHKANLLAHGVISERCSRSLPGSEIVQIQGAL
jgi:hypothetical protein